MKICENIVVFQLQIFFFFTKICISLLVKIFRMIVWKSWYAFFLNRVVSYIINIQLLDGWCNTCGVVWSKVQSNSQSSINFGLTLSTVKPLI